MNTTKRELAQQGSSTMWDFFNNKTCDCPKCGKRDSLMVFDQDGNAYLECDYCFTMRDHIGNAYAEKR